MILVTVGSQMAFDRLITAVDGWAEQTGRDDVFAQIGPTELRPRSIKWAAFLDPAEFRERVQGCDAIVAHAGMGSILTALEFGKPILVMPRRGGLNETRNDHQVATARRFKELGRIQVAMDEQELPGMLNRLGRFETGGVIGRFASASLIEAVRVFIHGRPVAGQVVEPKVSAVGVTVVEGASADSGAGDGTAGVRARIETFPQGSASR